MKSPDSSNDERQALLKYMRTRVKHLANEMYGSDASAFCHFVLQMFYGIDDEDAQAACGIAEADGSGIVGFWQDDENGRVVIVWGKYRASGSARLDRRAVLDIASAWARLTDPATKGDSVQRESIAEPAAALAQAHEQMPSLRVELLCVIPGTVTLAAHEQAEKFNSAHATEGVHLRLADIEDLIEADLERRSLDAGPLLKPIALTLREYFQEPQAGDVPTLVASIDGQQLAAIEQEYRFRIFQSNVRYQLPGKINENIDKTLKRADGRRNFWYYNNGISIVCDHFDLDDEHKTVRIHNLQIVNGCQTTTTLSANAERLSDPSSPAIVLVRIIASESSELQREITIYNNKQNAVKDRDLLSNDSHQERLQVEFERLTPPWFYERKRGSLKAEIGSSARRKLFASRIINNEKAAQSAYAFHHDPGEARARKRLLFVTRKDDANGFYDLLFNDATTPEWLLVPFLVNKYVVARKNEYLKELRALDGKRPNSRSVAEKRLIQRSWLKFSDQALIGAIAFYWQRRSRLSQPELEALLQPQLLERTLLPPSYALAVRDLSKFFVARVRDYQKRGEVFVAANYLKGNWAHIREHLHDEEDYRASMDEDPIAELPIVGGH